MIDVYIDNTGKPIITDFSISELIINNG